jgi:hypothetical protein
VRIGDVGITAIPCEVYGITGLKIKAQSPLRHTFNLELANGSEGYIPPPEQHVLGGYTTWPARSAALEVGAEPQIVETLISMLEDVSGRKRRALKPVLSAYDKDVIKSEPLAYWRLDEILGRSAIDATGNGNHGTYEDGVAFYLPGPKGAGMTTTEGPARCAHFAGGRIKADPAKLGDQYSLEMWFWNGLPADAREFTGFFFSRGSDRLGIGGVFEDAAAQGKLIYISDRLDEKMITGNSDIPLRTWNHLVFVRDGKRIAVYLNGEEKPQIKANIGLSGSRQTSKIYVGGSNDQSFNFEGKIAKVALFDRPLTRKEIVSHYAAAEIR